MMGSVVDIKLKRANKVYHEGETLSGLVIFSSKEAIQHQGITLAMDGVVSLQLSAKSVGVFEAFYNSVKPMQLISNSVEITKAGKLPSGRTEIPFEFPLKIKGSKVMYETYHGVFVNIQYTLRCDVRRPLLAKDLTKSCEFIVHSLRTALPRFTIRGRLDSTNCVITQPLTGELVVENSDMPVKSIELQLVRVETCGCAEGYARDATEIQNIQIADGNVCRNLAIPIYMVFPRLFTCPTLETTNFKVGINLSIVYLGRAAKNVRRAEHSKTAQQPPAEVQQESRTSENNMGTTGRAAKNIESRVREKKNRKRNPCVMWQERWSVILMHEKEMWEYLQEAII
ncbi:vacuolar protein sorting-associated protein 26C isoform X3 [Heterodontus francisci]|uniref:vacuolar protein sorting-associated protein 26C isoform X3 n=1 Tax=Heterodontus francisci TaxID=7792 RepID=UPI00355B3654